MAVYLVRHGQTDWNKNGTVQGRYDTELNQTGREQAAQAREYLKDVPLDVCFSSPLKRAMETASIILNGRDVPIKTDDRLVEMAYGVYEGTNWRAEEYQKLRRYFAYRYPKGESYLDVCYRAFSFLYEIKELAQKGNVLIVCHGGIARVIHSFFVDGVDNESFIDNICPNGGVREYEFVERSIPPVVPLPKE